MIRNGRHARKTASNRVRADSGLSILKLYGSYGLTSLSGLRETQNGYDGILAENVGAMVPENQRALAGNLHVTLDTVSWQDPAHR